jgi:RNA exonuclease 1
MFLFQLVHMTVIDTSLVFPHYYGMPFRRSLKSIVQSYLKREIQASVSCGHDSYEDARSGKLF